MDPTVGEWLNLLLRWVHVIAGIAWIGQTYLFNWMEKTFLAEQVGAEAGGSANVAGRLWMVHGGGFYLVEKQRVPELMPRTLHWFKWESALTWASGVLLLFLVFYNGATLIDSSESPVPFAAAAALGIFLLLSAFFAYDLLWRSPLGRTEWVGAAVSFLGVAALAFALTRVFSRRAAFFHVGALFGTVMAANVWLRILPAQRQMIAATKEGRVPDAALAAKAKRCSKHNTYLSVSVVAIMLSNHFPTITYGQDRSWLVLSGLVLLGGVAARVMRG